MSKNIFEVLSQRTDISRYLVHLTRDANGRTAKENLISILRGQTINAYNHHCLFSPYLRKEGDEIQDKFKVVSFTETPLDKIQLLTNISGRKNDLKPYGVVFNKNTIVKRRGNPAIYIYNENRLLKSYLVDQYNDFITSYKEYGELSHFFTMGSLVNIVSERHDFHWEREWRIRKNFKFDIVDLFAIIAPENEHNDIRWTIQESTRSNDIDYCIFIDPLWNMEEIVDKFAIYVWDELKKK